MWFRRGFNVSSFRILLDTLEQIDNKLIEYDDFILTGIVPCGKASLCKITRTLIVNATIDFVLCKCTLKN